MDENIINQLKAKGYKITPARRGIVGIFCIPTRPISADFIRLDLTKNGVKVDKTAIYRALDVLLANSIIKQVKIAGDENLYELSQREHHHHVVCTNCGDIDDVIIQNESGIVRQVQKQTPFIINDHALEFYGYCRRCA